MVAYLPIEKKKNKAFDYKVFVYRQSANKKILISLPMICQLFSIDMENVDCSLIIF